MHMKRLFNIFIGLVFTLLFTIGNSAVFAQASLVKDYSYVMDIPRVESIVSSPAHMYVLSGNEGLAVFRTHPDTLQWLYTSPGMQKRGNTMTADVRFAYLFGKGNRLTVLEPTSVLGVYSSTELPDQPLDAVRINRNLYLALGSDGLGMLSLKSPESVDSAVTYVGSPNLKNEGVIDLERFSDQLYVLTGQKKLYVYELNDGKFIQKNELGLSRNIEHIFTTTNELLGSDDEGNLYTVDSNGNLSRFASIQEPVQKIRTWKDRLIIKGTSGRIWISQNMNDVHLWKNDGNAGNYFSVSKEELWLCEYDHISRIIESDNTSETSYTPVASAGNAELDMVDIDNYTIPLPHSLLIPLQLKGNYPLKAVKFAYRSPSVQDAKIRKEGFYWSPGSNDVGQHKFTIYASSSTGDVDSTSFKVNVSSFNAPPRFTPLRPMTIPMGEKFELPLQAVDPDGMNSDLIRYLGVDLPEGANLDEKTGDFTWLPSDRQTGQHTFKVIATDQYGAASSAKVQLNVIEAQRGDSNR